MRISASFLVLILLEIAAGPQVRAGCGWWEKIFPKKWQPSDPLREPKEFTFTPDVMDQRWGDKGEDPFKSMFARALVSADALKASSREAQAGKCVEVLGAIDQTSLPPDLKSYLRSLVISRIMMLARGLANLNGPWGNVVSFREAVPHRRLASWRESRSEGPA